MAAALSVAAASACCIAHSVQVSRASELRQRTSATEAGLRGRIDGGSEYSVSRLNLLREKVHRFQVQLGTKDTWEQVDRLFASRWSHEATPRDDHEGYSTQCGTFLMRAPCSADWGEIVDTVGKAEALPGASVSELEISTEGEPAHQAVDLVRVVVSVRSRKLGEKQSSK